MFPIRRATPADAALIVLHRRAMFEAMGRGTAADLDHMCRTFEPWLAPRLADDRYLGWITLDDDKPIASAGLFLLDWPPVPHDPFNTTRGYLLNIFVEPAYRRQGLARSLIAVCMTEARRRGIRILSLHASHEGRPLYESLGFHASNEMQFHGPADSSAHSPIE